MKWLKPILIALAVLLVIAVALPFFISLNDYIPRIEKEVSARLKEPVSIKSIKFAALPLPHVTVDGITVGKTDDIKLGKVMLTPRSFLVAAIDQGHQEHRDRFSGPDTEGDRKNSAMGQVGCRQAAATAAASPGREHPSQ